VPLQNRVTPFGAIVADPARGDLMGNRGGRFHDPASPSLGVRRWASRRWISCVTEFRGRARRVWETGYTELFFLDEVTALAAGHRPCAECRRRAARLYQAVLPGSPALDDIDMRLHAERLDGRAQRRSRTEAATLPDGAMVAVDGRAFALRGEHALEWSPDGYAEARPRPTGDVEVLTPATSLAALRGGYDPLWHRTATGAPPTSVAAAHGMS
jgi:hypothetical protein